MWIHLNMLGNIWKRSEQSEPAEGSPNMLVDVGRCRQALEARSRLYRTRFWRISRFYRLGGAQSKNSRRRWHHYLQEGRERVGVAVARVNPELLLLLRHPRGEARWEPGRQGTSGIRNPVGNRPYWSYLIGSGFCQDSVNLPSNFCQILGTFQNLERLFDTLRNFERFRESPRKFHRIWREKSRIRTKRCKILWKIQSLQKKNQRNIFEISNFEWCKSV